MKHTFVLLLPLLLCTVRAEDWNQFRGPNRDNISGETDLLNQWPDDGPPLLMTVTGIGEGYSAVSVVGDVIYTMGNVDGGEHLIAIDRNSGQILWKARNGDEYKEGQGNGPRGTPTVVNGQIFALGANGDLGCYDAANGQSIWQKNILQQFGGSNIVWGISESVLVDDGKVICSPGGNQATVVALNAKDGSVTWQSQVPEQPQASYASPMIANVGRIKQYIIFTSKGICGIRANDGTPLWGQNKSSNSTANCATPLIIGSSVFSSSDYGTGCELINLRSRGDRTVAQLVYNNKEMKNHHGGMFHQNGFVYGSSGNILSCVNLKTGHSTWKQRSMKGAVVYADGKFVFRHEDGDVFLVSANPQAYEELGRFSQPGRSGRPAWSHPVISGGRLYLRDMNKLFVYDLKP